MDDGGQKSPERDTSCLTKVVTYDYMTLMATQRKGRQRLGGPMNTRITLLAKERVNRIAFSRSTEKTLVKPAQVIREAVEIGLDMMEKKSTVD